jgi:hypothetical protein
MPIPVMIVTHPARRQMAHRLAKKVGFPVNLMVDFNHEGCAANHLNAYRALAINSPVTDWVCVLEDDAVPCQDFRHQLQMVAQAAPSPFVSLYLGRERPPHWQDSIRQVIAPLDYDPHFLLGTHVNHTVGMLVRRDQLDHVIDWFETTLRDDPKHESDGIMTHAVADANYDVAYTRPSIVDHADPPSLIPASDRHDKKERGDKPRVAWIFDTREVWLSDSLTIPTPAVLLQQK